MIELKSKMLSLTLSLYSNPVIPRNVVQDFVDKIIDFTNNSFTNYINEQISFKCKDKQFLSNIEEILDSTKVVLRQFETEYQRFSLYREMGLLTMPIDEPIGIRIPKKLLGYGVPADIENVTAQYIPLKQTLKLVLELPGMFQMMMDYIAELKAEKSIISNFIQTECWQEMSKSFGNKIVVVPLFSYSDEFEAGNALGSHGGTNKLSSLYTILPYLSPLAASQLDNIL